MMKSMLANGIEIELRLDGSKFTGIGSVRAAGQVLRKGDAAIRPMIATMDGIVFCEFVKPDIAQDGAAVIIRCKALGRWQSATDDMVSHWWPVRTGLDYLAPTETFEGELTWRLEPRDIAIGGVTFSGFVSRYAFRGPAGKYICRLEDRSTWEIGGSTDGNTLIERCYYTPEKHEVDLARGVDYSTSGRKKMEGFGGWAFQYSLRWGGSIAPFDFLFNKDGALIRGFEKPSYIRSWLFKRTGDDRLGCFDEHFAEAAPTIETVGTFVGFAHAPVSWSRTDARNLWTAVLDYYNDQACQFARTRPKPIRPMMTLPNGLDHPFRHTADTLAEPAAELGFKVLWLHPIWDSEMNRAGGYGNGCSVYDWIVAKELGGEDGLKYLADKVHQHGMLLIAWCGGIRQGWEHNAWVRENKHSEWLARYINHRQFGSGYDCMTSLDMNCDEAYRYVIETCRGVIERTGLDGFFWDSYVDAWEEVVSPWPMKMKPAFHRVVEMTAELQSFCRYFTVEAQPPWARPCVGNGIAGLSSIEGCHYANYGRYFGNIEADRPDMMDFYFRNLAYGAGSVMEWYELPKIMARADMARQLRQINRNYMAAQSHMGTRRLVEDDRGVEWTSADGRIRVYFSFADGAFLPLQRAQDVRCLTTGQSVTCRRDGSFAVKAQHVYSMTKE